MTFGEAYLTHLRALQDIGMTHHRPREFKGQKIIPLRVSRARLPPGPPLSARNHTGKTCIGCQITGERTASRRLTLSTTCAITRNATKEVKAQAVKLALHGRSHHGWAARCSSRNTWKGEGVFNGGVRPGSIHGTGREVASWHE